MKHGLCQKGDRYFFPPKLGEKKWKAQLMLDVPRPFQIDNPMKMKGLRTGAQFNGVHRFGIGIHFLKKNALFSTKEIEVSPFSDSVFIHYNLTYASIYYERVFYRSNQWEWSFPIYYSFGDLIGQKQDSLGYYFDYSNEKFKSLSARIQVKYFIFPWIAPKLSLGYRHTFYHGTAIRKKFNQPYFTYGLSIFLDELWKSYKSKRKHN